MDEGKIAAPLPQPVMETGKGNRALVLGAVMAMMFMIAIEGTIVATAMPTIVGALGGFDLFSWVFTAYLLTQAVTIPIYGRLADFYGRKFILSIGMGIFLGASLLCGFAWSMVPLVIFRAIQGVGAGALMPVGMTIVADIYAPAERARIQAYVSSVWVIAAIIAPMMGAFLVAHASWATVFWVNIPLGIVASAMIAVALKEAPRRRQHSIDYIGSLLMVMASGALMFVLVQAPKLSVASIIVIGGCAAAFLITLLIHEFRIREPMLPLSLWRNPIVVGGNLANLLIGAMLMGVTAFLPPYVQGVMEKTALTAGFMLTAMSASWPTGSAVAGQVMQRTSYRTSALAGGVLLVLGSAMLIFIAPERGVWFVALGALVAGFGMGLVNNSFIVSVQSNVLAEDRGVATSSLIFMRMVGQSLGTAVFGGIVNAGLSDRIAGGGNIVDRLLMPGFRNSLPADQVAALMHDVAHALDHVFEVNFALALALLAVCWLLPRGLSPIRGARH